MACELTKENIISCMQDFKDKIFNSKYVEPVFYYPKPLVEAVIKDLRDTPKDDWKGEHFACHCILKQRNSFVIDRGETYEIDYPD